jgi:hypothetical protein
VVLAHAPGEEIVGASAVGVGPLDLSAADGSGLEVGGGGVLGGAAHGAGLAVDELGDDGSGSGLQPGAVLGGGALLRLLYGCRRLGDGAPARLQTGCEALRAGGRIASRRGRFMLDTGPGEFGLRPPGGVEGRLELGLAGGPGVQGPHAFVRLGAVRLEADPGAGQRRPSVGQPAFEVDQGLEGSGAGPGEGRGGAEELLRMLEEGRVRLPVRRSQGRRGGIAVLGGDAGTGIEGPHREVPGGPEVVPGAVALSHGRGEAGGTSGGVQSCGLGVVDGAPGLQPALLRQELLALVEPLAEVGGGLGGGARRIRLVAGSLHGLGQRNQGGPTAGEGLLCDGGDGGVIRDGGVGQSG